MHHQNESVDMRDSPTVRGAASTIAEEPLTGIMTRCARITGPVSYRADTERKQNIPLRPCLVESIGGPLIDIVWGVRGQSSVALPVEEIAVALHDRNLVFLD